MHFTTLNLILVKDMPFCLLEHFKIYVIGTFFSQLIPKYIVFFFAIVIRIFNYFLILYMIFSIWIFLFLINFQIISFFSYIIMQIVLNLFSVIPHYMSFLEFAFVDNPRLMTVVSSALTLFLSQWHLIHWILHDVLC